MKNLLILFCVTMSGFSFSALAGERVILDRLEASVNSALIFKSEIRHFKKIEPLRSQLDPLYAGTALAAKGARATDKEIVDFLINEKLISQLFPVSDQEVEQEINSIQANNHIDRASLKSALNHQGFSFDDYFDLIRSSASKRNLIDRDIRTKVIITDNDVKNYFYNNYAKATGAIRAYKLRIIVVSTKSFKTPSAAKDAISRAQKALKDGDAFEEVAKRYSDDASASSGGELGTLTEDQMSPAIREQIKKLSIGQVSEVFGNPASAYYLLKLEDVTSDETGRLEKMKEEIRNQLIAAEYQHQIALWLERQNQNAFIHRAGEPSVSNLPTQP
jgi:peptidyl-prolyl cis-trans isomerase SurA